MNKNDTDHKIRIIIALLWCIVNLIFYYTTNKAAFIDDLWSSHKFGHNESGHNHFDSIFSKSEYTIIKREHAHIYEYNYKITCADQATFPDTLICSGPKALLDNSTDNIRFSSNNAYDIINILNVKIRTLTLWKCARSLILITVLLCLISLLLIRKKQEKLAGVFALFLPILLSIVNAIFVLIFGGVLSSPFGTIATTLFVIYVTNDTLKWYNGKRGISTTFIAYLPSIIFFIVHSIALSGVFETSNDKDYSNLISYFFNENRVWHITWYHFTVVSSAILGLATIRLRADDKNENSNKITPQIL